MSSAEDNSVRAVTLGDLVIIKGESIEEIERVLNQPSPYPRPTREELDKKYEELRKIWDKNIRLEEEERSANETCSDS